MKQKQTTEKRVEAKAQRSAEGVHTEKDVGNFF